MEPRLQRKLGDVAARDERRRRDRRSAVAWLAMALFAFGVWMARGVLAVDGWVLALGVIALGAAVVWLAQRSGRRPRDLVETARSIETAHPSLDSALLAAAELEPDLPNGKYGYLASRVVDEVLRHGRRSSWDEVVPSGSLRSASMGHLLASLLFIGGVLAVAWPRSAPSETVATVDRPARDVPPPVLVTLAQVDPGDVELERGRSLLVTATYPLSDVPDAVDVVFLGKDGSARRVAMERSLDDPVFAGRLPQVNGDGTYAVSWEDRTSPSYQVTVYEHPALEQSDLHLTPPAFTGLEPRVIEDARRATAVEGTVLKLVAMLNKPADAILVDREDNVVLRLVAEEGDARIMHGSIELRESLRLRLALVDTDGREAKRPVEFVFKVLPNGRPALQLTSARDVKVSPLQELTVGAKVHDDYGVERLGLSYRFGAQPSVDVVLAEQIPADEATDIEHLVAFEALEAKPDQLLSYSFWAEDRGVDGEVRRTDSDLFFAEVRPFEEIYREGEEPAGGQQENQRQQQEQNGEQGAQGNPGEQAAALAEQQRQIVLATWAQRRADDAEQRREDLAVVLEAQEQALTQLQTLAEGAAALGQMMPELAEGLPDPAEAIPEIAEAMLQSIDALERAEKASDDDIEEALEDALTQEQGAYEALLRMRAREFEVARAQQQQQQQQQQGGQSSRNQAPPSQQMQELDLQNSRNRYEAESQARRERSLDEESPADAADAAEEAAATREMLDRLRDLAKRQEDMGDRLQELEAELEAAETDEEREELERRLKRLQEAQEEILRDTEDLQQRMEEANQRGDLQEATEQLEETREDLRKANDALEEGDVSEARNQGARAERNLETLEETLRDRAGQQFEQRMEQMQDEARRLADDQQRIADALSGAPATNDEPVDRPNLWDDEPEGGEDLEADLQRQRDETERLLQEMEQTIQDAEQVEPLLAEELFDAWSEARERGVDDALEETQDLVERGFRQAAGESEREAREGIDALRDGIERAADEVLGGETEALERAYDEVDRLAEELQDEMERARDGERGQPGEPGERDPRTPGEQGQPGDAPPQDGEPREGQPGEGQPGEGQPREGEPQEGPPGGEGQPGEQPPQEGEGQPGAGDQPRPGEGQPGEGQPGERQPGEGTPGERQGRNGEPREGEPREGEPRDGEPQPGEPREGQLGQRPAPGGNRGGGGDARPSPLTGDDFRDWSDRLQDVEEMLDDPELSADAARVRSRARTMRAEANRHSEDPNWDLVDEMVVKPLEDLRKRLAEEIRARRDEEARVPLDRDPVPPRFSEEVRRYYERLGRDR